MHYLHIFFPILVSDYSTQQLSDRSDKQQQDYQQQFGLMNDQVMDSVQTGNINGAGHPSEFSPRGGGGEGTLSFPAASSKASSSVHSEYILFWITHPKMAMQFSYKKDIIIFFLFCLRVHLLHFVFLFLGHCAMTMASNLSSHILVLVVLGLWRTLYYQHHLV